MNSNAAPSAMSESTLIQPRSSENAKPKIEAVMSSSAMPNRAGSSCLTLVNLFPDPSHAAQDRPTDA